MDWNLLNQPLGSACPTGNAVKKEMPIPLAIPIAMAAASALSSVFGGAKSAQAAKREQQRLADEKARTEAERMRAKNEDYIDTAAGQNLIRIARDERDKMWRREAGAAAVGGGTDAAVALAKERGNQMIGDTIANIAAQDTARKDSIDASYRQQLSGLTQQQIAAERARSEAIAQAAGGVSSALMQGAVATFGGTKLGQQWMGTGSPGGGGVSAPSQLQQMGSSQGVADFAAKDSYVQNILKYNRNYSFLRPNITPSLYSLS